MKLICLALLIGLFGCNRSHNNDLEPLDLNDKKERRVLFLNFLDSVCELGEQNPDEAIKILDARLVNENSKSNRIDIIYCRGKLYSSLNHLDNALKDLNTVVYYNEYPECFVARASVYMKLKRYYNAELDLKKAVSLNKKYNWHLGNFYEIVGDTSNAIRSYKFLYMCDQKNYDYCQERIECLTTTECSVFSEIQQFTDSGVILRLNTDIN